MGTTLDHVMVVGGTPKDWDATTDDEWAALADRLGGVAAEAGAQWLTIRPYGPEPAAAGRSPKRWHRSTAGGRCIVIVDSTADGKLAFAEAAASIPPGEPVDEQSIARRLYAPADAEPDLVVILGPPDRLPSSLVWELAYGELFFVARGVPVDMTAADLELAIDTFHGRSRRFGGLDG